MPYILSAAIFLIQTAFGLFIGLFLLRFLLIAVGLPFHEPICQFVYRLTNPVIAPLRRFVPRWRKFELAALLIAWLLVLLESMLLDMLLGRMRFFGLLAPALVSTLDWIIWIELGAILVYCVLSFFPSMRYEDGYRLLDRFVAPIVNPFRRWLPPIGGFDFSCWFASVALILARLLVIAPLADLAARL